MQTTLAAVSFALATTALSILAPSAPAVAEANRHGYVNYRNYDDGPESLAAFRAYHRNARLNATARSQSSVPSSTSIVFPIDIQTLNIKPILELPHIEYQEDEKTTGFFRFFPSKI
jgi:hypothetical protein